MASRFRFAYFEDPDRIGATFDDKLTDRDFETNCRQVLYDIDRLEHEAMEFGLDPVNFVRAFGDEKKAIAESFVDNWTEAKNKLYDVIPSGKMRVDERNRATIKQSIIEFLNAIESENKRFLSVAIDLYRDKMRPQLLKTV